MNSEVTKLLEKAWARRREEKYEDVESLLTEARSLCGEEDYDALGRIYHIYMQIDYDKGHLTKALVLCHQSLAYYKKLGIPERIAHSTRHLADLQCHLGQHVESENNYQKAINMYKESSTLHAGNLANALRGYAIVLENLNKLNEARTTWSEVKTLYQSLGIQAGVDEASKRMDALGL